jgi:hypothetical protein
MLLGRMESSRGLGPCMDAEVDPLRSVARRLRLREGCSMGKVSRRLLEEVVGELWVPAITICEHVL